MWVKRKLGVDVNQIEIVDEQIVQEIFDTADILNRYLHGDASYEDFLRFELVPHQDTYALPQNVYKVIRVLSSGMGIGAGYSQSEYLWSNNNYMAQSGMLSGFQGTSSFQQPDLLGYESSMQILKLMETYFDNSVFQYQFNENRSELLITPTPTKPSLAVIKVVKKELVENLFNHVLYKKLLLAKCKIVFGQNIGKYSVTLPGGGTINWERWISEGREDEKEVEERIDQESENCGYFFLG